MSWTEIAPAASKGKTIGAAVEFAIGTQLGVGDNRPPIVQIKIRLHLLHECLAWLSAGASVKAQVGSGEHAGLLRVSPGTAHRIAKSGGRGASDTSLLRLPMLPGLSAELGRSICEFDYGDDWMEFTIPDWAKQPAARAPAASAPVPAAVPPKKASFSMVGDVGSDKRRAK